MTKTTKLLSHLFVLCTIFAVSGVSTFASNNDNKNKKAGQISSLVAAEPAKTESLNEKSPFDFSDTYYKINGIDSYFIVDRRNGDDKQSVFDYKNDENFANVRVIRTNSAYDHDGLPMLYSHFGNVPNEAFLTDDVGQYLKEVADRTPIYFFPSVLNPGFDRQSALMDFRSQNEDENKLGVHVVRVVTYTFSTMSTDDAEFLGQLIEKYGESSDGTPLIRNADVLMELVSRGLVSIRKRGHSGTGIESPYAIVPGIADPTNGAIAKDAHLMKVLMPSGKPLQTEDFFVDWFNCLQNSEGQCYPDK